jgi:hypothetical protein
MSVYQTIQAINNLTVNRKGALAFSSTGDKRLDLFTLCSRDPYMTKENFNELYELMIDICKNSPDTLLQLLAFQRSILKGNGIKHYYYLGLNILEKCCLDTDLYTEMIRFSYQYTKDLYHFGRPGLVLFAEKILEQIFMLLSPTDETVDPLDKNKRFDPMLFKYLGYENSHWKNEKKIIQIELNARIEERINEFIQLVNSTEDLKKDALQTRLVVAVRELFRNSVVGDQIFTNRRMRILKTIFNKENHLPEYLYAGKHYDGTLLDETFDITGKFYQSSIDKIAKDFSQTSSLATALLCKSFNKLQQLYRNLDNNRRTEFIDKIYQEPTLKRLTLRQELLLDGYIQYKKNIAEKLVKVKEVGVDLGVIAYEYFLTGEDSTGLEEQLTSRINRLKEEWLPLFDNEFTIDKFRDSFRVIMDRSGSMIGIPLQAGLLYLLILSVIFRVKEIVYFDDKVEVRQLTDSDLDGPILELLKKIYTQEQGYTELIGAFKYLEQNHIGNNIVVIISDGDCDPDPENKNNISVFHEAFNTKKYKYLPTNQYVVMNVNEKTMKFPYMNFHERTSFITGTSTVQFLIEALIECSKNNLLLTPGLVLKKCLNSQNFKLPESIISGLSDINRFDTSQLSTDKYELDILYRTWIRELPNKKESIPEKDDILFDIDENGYIIEDSYK